MGRSGSLSASERATGAPSTWPEHTSPSTAWSSALVRLVPGGSVRDRWVPDRWVRRRERDDDGEPPVWSRVCVDGGAVGGGDRANDRKPQTLVTAVTDALLSQAAERLGQDRHLVGGDA